MTLKEELEILRGEPILVYDDDPMDIPCIETSDPDKLCKHPIVSVHMITYNHEPYIRQAIEGVMMQKTDFEFELVIGEDCSQDNTREICFEFQKKYPDKIRVLWWHENVSKFGGNGRRNRAHCRGEFIAICEGDDYWIDPLKLQKQVDVMRQYPSVGYCVANSLIKCEIPKDTSRVRVLRTGEWIDDSYFKYDMHPWKAGFQPRDVFWANRRNGPRTATVMFREEHYRKLCSKLEIFKWKLKIGDALLWYGFPSVCDAFLLSDVTSVYRIHSNGASMSIAAVDVADNIYFELLIVKFYFETIHDSPLELRQEIVERILMKRLKSLVLNRASYRSIRKLLKTSVFASIWGKWRFCWEFWCLLQLFNVRILPSVVPRMDDRIRHPFRSCLNMLRRCIP